MTPLNIVLLFFVATFLGVVYAYMWYAEIKTSPRYFLKKRMRSLAVDASDRRFPTDLRVEIMRDMGYLDRFLYRFSLTRSLNRLIETTGTRRVDAKGLILLVIASGAAAYILGWALGFGALFPVIVFSPAGASIPIFYLTVERQRRIARFTEQLPDALDMVARSLRAGHSLSAALQMVGSEMSDPIAGLFKTAYEEQTFGLPTREALEHIAKLMPTKDLKFFVMATNIHREVGGNLGEILSRLANTIRERIKIRRQVRVYTAQAKLSGYILVAVPVFMALLFYIFMPGYMEELFSVKWGIYAVYVAIAAQIAGFFVIKKIINIKI